MKKMIILAALVIVSSCSVYRPYQALNVATFLDYRPYVLEGFFVSSDAYPDVCETLGELRMEYYPEQVVIKNADYDKYEMFSYRSMKWYGFPRIQYAQLLQNAVARAKSMGADGLANFSIEHRTDGLRPYYIIHGSCIKR